MVCAVSLMALALPSCSDEPEQDTTVERTLFVYLPWTSNLTDYLSNNIKEIESVIAQNGLGSQRVLVYFATSSTESSLFEIVPKKGGTTRKTLKTYTNADLDLATSEGIASLLTDVKTFSPSLKYSMIVGCHGYGWLMKSEFGKKSSTVLRSIIKPGADAGLLTRFMGGATLKYQLDIPDFVDGVNQTDLHFEYIAFESCYMASTEALYDMRNLADYIVASPCEMMASGFPYTKIGKYLLGEPDLNAFCQGFFDYYSTADQPYGTLSLIDCSQLEGLATVMKKINASCAISDMALVRVQRLDYFNPVIFYDLGDYVTRMVDDAALLSEFEEQMAKTVLCEVHTSFYYTGTAGRIQLNTCSGLSVSDPTNHSYAASKEKTSWWKATH